MELFKLFGKIVIDNSEANDGIDETTDKAESAHPKISSAFSKIGDAAVKAGQVIATGLAAGSAAIGALAKDSLGNYADYEQLVGGVETLFKGSSGTVLNYADRAYETAGLSANEYMETVTSFSASLLQSLGGDTDKAVELADRAITDMADNANKMGTNMSMIQNAYQGFAKQNYTMLDNLKLGYGGTATEMARLINDSGVLGDKLIDLDDTKNIGAALADVGFAKLIEAIGIIQDRIGITGTTAKEASATISGSVASMKAQWQNLLTALAGDGWDIGVYIYNFVESAKTAMGNLVPRIAQILSGISEAMAQIMPVVAAELPAILQALLPGLIDGAMALVTGLVQSLPVILSILIAELPNIIQQLCVAIVTTFPILLQTVKDLFSQIWDYIAVELLGTEADFETSFGKIKEFFEKLWAELQSLWETVGKPIWDAIRVCIGIVRDAFAERMPAIKEFVSSCFKDIRDFWNNNLKPCFEAIADFINKNLAPVFEDVFKNKILPFIDDCFGGIKDLWNKSLKPIFTGITDFLTGVFTGNWRKAWQGIASIFSGIWEGIKTAFKLPINWIIDGINNFIRGINKIQIPDWVPAVGGKGFSIKEIPRLERGGILEKGQVGLLEGNGAEAVVPLDQNRAWISAVAKDMQLAIGGGNNQEIKELKEAFQDFVQALPDMMIDAFEAMRFDVNQREFARMVKAVN